MITVQQASATPVALVESAKLRPSVRARVEARNESLDNVHVRFAANIGRALHARAVRELGKIATRHPDLFIAYADNLITIPSPAAYGFTMSIVTDRGRCTVILGQWEDDFASVEEAVGLIEDAIRGDVRLRVDLDDRDARWILERRLPDRTWLEQPRTADRITPRSGRRPIRTVYFHNDFQRIAWGVVG